MMGPLQLAATFIFGLAFPRQWAGFLRRPGLFEKLG
jgi:hypothetical protein